MQKSNFLQSNNFLAHEQFGHSALNSIINNGRIQLNFPRIWLHLYGFQGTASEWFKWYLHNRNKDTKFKLHYTHKMGHYKTWCLTSSALVPLHFITYMYINDFPQQINCKPNHMVDTRIVIFHPENNHFKYWLQTIHSPA